MFWRPRKSCPSPGPKALRRREKTGRFSPQAALTAEEQTYIKDLQQQAPAPVLPALRLLPALFAGDQYSDDDGPQIGDQTLRGRGGRSAWIKAVVEKARSCTECGECLPRCPYQLPIPETIKKNLEFYNNLKI